MILVINQKFIPHHKPKDSYVHLFHMSHYTGAVW